MSEKRGYIENFINSINFESSECRDLARVLLQSESDCNNFYIGFLGRSKHKIDDLLDYRESKLSDSNITIDLFLEMCYNEGMRDSFEKTFFQSFSSIDIAMVSNSITEGKTSLKELYAGFQKNPNINILKYVL